MKKEIFEEMRNADFAISYTHSHIEFFGGIVKKNE